MDNIIIMKLSSIFNQKFLIAALQSILNTAVIFRDQLRNKLTNPDNRSNILGLSAIWVWGMIVCGLHAFYSTEYFVLHLYLQVLSPFIGWFVSKYHNKVFKLRGKYYNEQKRELKLPNMLRLVPIIGFFGLFSWQFAFGFSWGLPGAVQILWGTLIPNTIAYGYYIMHEFPATAIFAKDQDSEYEAYMNKVIEKARRAYFLKKGIVEVEIDDRGFDYYRDHPMYSYLPSNIFHNR